MRSATVAAMSDVSGIAVIRPQVCGQEALQIVESTAGAGLAHLEQCIYYPYFRFEAQTQLRALFAKRRSRINCLVDGRRGHAATTDDFDVDADVTATGSALGCLFGTAAAERNARHFLSHALTRRLKTIANFDLDLTSLGIVYRKFWLVRCDGRIVMVDSVTGGLHPLRKAA